MCGIAGWVGAGGGREVLDAMLRALEHRGPDDTGRSLDGEAALGMTRLSIIDLVTGQQPMRSEDGALTLVFNGEIYNFRDLRGELQARGRRFATRSDTEVLLRAWEAYGPACVDRLRGMFAFAVWDARRRRLFLARDRVGKKPLYYTEDLERFCFASELKALLQDPARKRAIDLEALDGYFSFGCVQGPATILEGVAQLPPAHVLVWERGSIRVSEYWDVPRDAVTIRDERKALEGFTEVFSDAVRVRLVSDVALGAFLSGGVDSSAVVTAMAALGAGPVVTTSVECRCKPPL